MDKHNPTPGNNPVLQVRDLSVSFPTVRGLVHAVDQVSWHVDAGECLAIVGESGSGKSVSALGIMGLLPASAQISGSITFDGRDLLQMSERERRHLRGGDVAMVFQDPLSALNPVYQVGHQLVEAMQAHQRIGRREAQQRAVELLHEVGIANPQQRAKDYPHQFSGGMRQRVVIAMALANDPRVLIADEPTTALDVTVQAQVMDLLHALRERRKTALVLITHDLGVVAGHADRALVMYAGRVAESCPVDVAFHAPRHHYTCGLLASMTRIDTPRQERLDAIAGQAPSLIDMPQGCAFHPRCPRATDTCRTTRPTLCVEHAHAVACHHQADAHMAAHAGGTASHAHRHHHGHPRMRVHSHEHQHGQTHTHNEANNTHPHGSHAHGTHADGSMPVVLAVDHLFKTFGKPGRAKNGAGQFHAVRDVSLRVHAGETVGLVGESGCGKSTLGRCILRLHEPTSGTIRFRDEDLLAMNDATLRATRRHIQMVFQDPLGCLDPRFTVRELLTEPFAIHGVEVGDRVEELLHRVGLTPEHASRRPHEFSGGQLQRIGIARAIALNPALVICDEPVSALDVSIQAQVINLLCEIQEAAGIGYLFIAHDLSVVRHIADRVAVMYRGQIVEFADVDELFAHPLHPYTQTLLSAVPIPNPSTEHARAQSRILLHNEAQEPGAALCASDGCAFAPRCPLRPKLSPTQQTQCGQAVAMREVDGTSHLLRCHAVAC